eukprot:TRINITY_DN55301_c0_g1_i1.p1 TRINITY_DN55301_c0_g1~~TRINITY_DN55301_c0_g1_i1.p1  ORF type:complete len:701 (+),score=207.28 TRINITY_DN55301_c0_g1_i1:78-2105(+)
MESPLSLGVQCTRPPGAPRPASLARAAAAAPADAPLRKEKARSSVHSRVRQRIARHCRSQGKALSAGELHAVDAALSQLLSRPGGASDLAVRKLAARFSARSPASPSIAPASPAAAAAPVDNPLPTPRASGRATAGAPAGRAPSPAGRVAAPRPASAPPRGARPALAAPLGVRAPPREQSPRPSGAAAPRGEPPRPWGEAAQPPRPGGLGSAGQPPRPCGESAPREQPARPGAAAAEAEAEPQRAQAAPAAAEGASAEPAQHPAAAPGAPPSPRTPSGPLDPCSVAAVSVRRQRELGLEYQLSAPARRERRLAAELEWNQVVLADRREAELAAEAARRRAAEKRLAQCNDLDSQVAFSRSKREQEEAERRRAAEECTALIELHRERERRERAARRELALRERDVRECQISERRLMRELQERADAEMDARQVQRNRTEMQLAREWEHQRRERGRCILAEALAAARRSARVLGHSHPEEVQGDFRESGTVDWVRRACDERQSQLSLRNEEASQAWRRDAELRRSAKEAEEARSAHEQMQLLQRTDERDRSRRLHVRAMQREVRAALDRQVQEKRARRAAESLRDQAERRTMEEHQELLRRRDEEKQRRAREDTATHRAFLNEQLQQQFERDLLPLQTSLARPLTASSAGRLGSLRRAAGSARGPGDSPAAPSMSPLF